jgi:hypothetical protein
MVLLQPLVSVAYYLLVDGTTLSVFLVGCTAMTALRWRVIILFEF